MFKTKDEQEKAERNWINKCEAEGLRCASCNQIPPYGEQEIFFETGMCALCSHTFKKDD